MPLMIWRDEFSVNVPSIDTQHKKLIDMLNELFDGMQTNKSREILGPVLDGLVAYTVEHFKYEENLLSKTSYADTPAHLKEHENLKQKVIDAQMRYKNATTGAMSIEIVNFMKNWLTNHILGTDMKYKEHLLAHGVK